MANTVTITKTNEGRKATFHIYLRSDGSTGDLDGETIIDPTVDLGLNSDARMSVENIIYSLFGFQGRIEFDTGVVEDKMMWLMHGTDTVDFRPLGDLKDRSGLDGTGKLLLTTTGLTSTDDEGSILITMKV